MQREAVSRGWWGRTWPALLAVSTVGAVGVPAAVASYRHAHDVIALNGDPVMAPWLPLSVDGMLVAALVVIWVRRHRGDRAGAFPWLAFGFGMVVTILANLAAVADPKPEAVAVALFPPLALAITLELVAHIAYRSGRSRARAGQAAPGSVALENDEPIVIGYLNEVDEHSHGSPDWWAGAPVATDEIDDVDEQGGDEGPVSGRHHTVQDHDTAEAGRTADPRVEDLARRLGAGEELTGRAVGDEFGVSARTGRRLIRQAADLQRCKTGGPVPLALVTAGGGA